MPAITRVASSDTVGYAEQHSQCTCLLDSQKTIPLELLSEGMTPTLNYVKMGRCDRRHNNMIIRSLLELLWCQWPLDNYVRSVITINVIVCSPTADNNLKKNQAVLRKDKININIWVNNRYTLEQNNYSPVYYQNVFFQPADSRKAENGILVTSMSGTWRYSPLHCANRINLYFTAYCLYLSLFA